MARFRSPQFRRLSSSSASVSALAAGDVNGDGKADVVFAVSEMATARSNPGSAYPAVVAIANLNGDGKPDVVPGNYCARQICRYTVRPPIVSRQCSWY